MASLPDHLMPVPIGKARIAREVVEEHRRDRVLDSAAAVFSERGYRATTVEDLVGAARIGVGSFYSLFAGKEDCFLSLYDRIVADARERLGLAVGEGAWAERVRSGMRELLEQVAADPDRARVVLVEANTAGPEAERRYAGTVAELSAALREGREEEAGGSAAPASSEAAVVAGLAWLLHRKLSAGEPVLVDELLPEIEGFLLGPCAEA